MLLAQFEGVPAEFLKNAVLIGAGVFAMIAYGKEIFGSKKKREVSFEADPATKEELEKHADWDSGEHDKLFRKIGGVERGAQERLDKKVEEMERKADDARERIHKRLNRISVGLANLCGRVGAEMPTEEEEV
jgi:hypothetical protein